jgi:hypothetical protein
VLERTGPDGGDLTLAEQALAALRAGIATLKAAPFTCRRAGQSPLLREMIVSSRAIWSRRDVRD